MKNFQKVKELIGSAEKDAGKFYEKGNHAAGTRLRKMMQQLKASALEIRQEVSVQKNKGK